MLDNQKTEFLVVVNSSIVKPFEDLPGRKDCLLPFDRTHHAIETFSAVIKKFNSEIISIIKS